MPVPISPLLVFHSHQDYDPYIPLHTLPNLQSLKMRSLTYLTSTLPLLHFTTAAWPSDSPLILKVAPKTIKPYVLPAMEGFSFNFNGQVGRVLASNDSTGGAYTLLSFNSGFTPVGTVHSHSVGSESIYSKFISFLISLTMLSRLSFIQKINKIIKLTQNPVVKGSINLWSNNTGRIGTQNDFQLLPPNNTHSFALRDYDSEAIVSFQPGGYDSLLLLLGAPYNSSTNSPYDPQVFVPINGTAAIANAAKYGINFKFDAKLNLDFTNGTTPDGLGEWHVKNQTLPGREEPYFLASNFGPKFLHRGTYQVIIPLATGAETRNAISIATIAMAKSSLPNLSIKPTFQSFKAPQTFKVLEGQLTVTIGGNAVNLIAGDTIHIPAGQRFKYESKVFWTRFYSYCSGGGDECLAGRLIGGAESWDACVFPGN